MNNDLTKLTPAESLWLWRKRLGLTQTKAAARLGVGRTTLWFWETGRLSPSAEALSKAASLKAGPAPCHLARLARRRARTSLRQAALALGVSHTAFLRLEALGTPEITAYWAKRGFTFV